METNKRPDSMARINTPELAQAFIDEQVAALRAQVGDKKVLLALSGGVDSSVVAALLIRAIGRQLVCVHVNHGLMRKGESEQVVEVFRNQLGANLIYVDAVDRFLTRLEGVSDPEQKRKIIGAEFIRVFEEEARKLEGIEFLAQGTIYPDIVESHGVKAHHNVGGLPDDLKFDLVEPLRLLFKDEVRQVGAALGLPDSMVYRQPFPGPGLGVRCLGAITRDRLAALRESDAILREEFDRAGLTSQVWQFFTIVPDMRSTGVRDGARVFDWPVIIRAVNTVDAMTATVPELPWALSGGVDSSVVAALLIRAIGRQLVCVHVNHGLMRKGESEQVVEVFRNQLGANLIYVDAVDRFLTRLEGVSDPEQKRKIIGAEFIRVFEEEARKLEGIEFLAQGTIYPDIVESHGVKAHHNVGGLPDDLKFDLVEPLRLLFKDEVRQVGAALGLPDSMVYRQPFPGPGLGVRCLGAITRDRLAALRESDAILREEFDRAGLTSQVWQFFTIVPDMRSTGVRDGARVFDWPVIIRAVNTVDAMTATVPELPWALLKRVTDRVLSEVPGVCRVLYDLSPKPVGTIEWE